MSSRIKILPSDVVLMIIDYLDSPSMMNCREVCRSWLDVVDGNRFLFNYFLVLDDNRRYTLNMLNYFSAKSNHSLKAFQLYPYSKRYEDDFHEDAIASRETSNAIFETLLKSKDSLKLFFHSWEGNDYHIASSCIEGFRKFPKLKTFYGESMMYSRLSVCIRSGNNGIVPGATLPSPLAIATWVFKVFNGKVTSLLSFIRASASTLVHLNVNITLSGKMKLSFPNLQVLDLPSDNGTAFNGDWEVPKLKVLALGIMRKASLATNFPSSIEELWLVSEGWTEGSLKRKGLDCLKKLYPRVQVFKMDFGVGFYPDEVIKMVKARKAAVKKGVSVDGVKMRAIEKLILDFRSIEDETSLSKLQELVPEVVDAARASNEITIHC